MNVKLCDNEWLKKKKFPIYKSFSDSVNIVDIFSGCGGLTLGAIEACYKNGYNGEISLAVELNKSAAVVYGKNFNGNVKSIHNGNVEDIITNYPGEPLSISEMELKELMVNVDVLLAGPPCQGHSRLNNHTRSADPRNKLYLKVIRFVEICRPKFIIIENVLNIRYDSSGVIESSNNLLREYGYNVFNLKVNTVDYGIAQKRIRHVQVASLESINIDLDKYKDFSTLESVIDDIVDDYKVSKSIFETPSVTKHSERIDYLFDNNIYDLPDDMRPNCHKNKNHTYPTSYGRLKWNEPCTTITRGFSTMGQGRFVHPLRKRTLTPHEAARIQGFPDFFCFSSVQKRGELHLMIANAVPPKISAMLVDQYLSTRKGG